MMPNYFKVSYFDMTKLTRNLLQKTDTLSVCCVCSKTQNPGFVIQCFVWGDRSWPIRARLRDLQCRSAQDRREREPVCGFARGYHRAASPRVTVGQMYWCRICIITEYSIRSGFSPTHMSYYRKNLKENKIYHWYVSD